MKTRLLVVLLLLVTTTLAELPMDVHAQEPPDFPIPNGHFYTQGTGVPGGDLGFRITDEGGVPFWSEFQRLGGADTLGFPISQRFVLQGFVHQATQKAILQWQPESSQVTFLNIFDLLHDAGKDDQLLAARSTPRSIDFSNTEAGRTFGQIVVERLALLAANPAIQARYFAVSSAIDPTLIYGLPTSGVQDMGNHFAIRLQRSVIQQWKVNTPWAAAGETTVANGGEIAKEFGLIPAGALEPVSRGSLGTVDVPLPSDQLLALSEAVKPSVVRLVVPSNGFGSGFVFDSGDLILTNYHVVEGAVSVLVETQDGRTLSGFVVGTDPLVDVAIIRVDSLGLRPLPLGDSEAVHLGDDVLAIGYSPAVVNPPSARVGKVIDLINADQPLDEVNVALIESDVFLHPGDSGGPLLNASGQVIGMNTSILFVPGDETVVVSQSLAVNLLKLEIDQVRTRQRTSLTPMDGQHGPSPCPVTLAFLPFQLADVDRQARQLPLQTAHQ